MKGLLKEKAMLKGFVHVQLGRDKDGKIIIEGDSGWIENQIVNLGWQDYILALIGGVNGSKQVSRAILGTGGVPASNATAVPGETARSSSINAVTSGSFTLQFTTQWASGDHPGGTPDIDVAGLINDTASGGTIMCGQSFDSSTWNSNQGVSLTYEIQKA